MNEFTKEELELILSDVSQGDCEYTRSPAQEELLFKIQRMIDNYSEFECPSCGRNIISE